MIEIELSDIEARTDEWWNEEDQIFVYDDYPAIKGGVFRFENSLKAIALWESKWRKSWFGTTGEDKTEEMMYDYLSFMCLDRGFKRELLTQEAITELVNYCNTEHTASTINSSGSGPKYTITSELLYAYMAISGIPYSADEWEINRLLMTIGIVGILNNPDKKKMSKQEIYASNKELNAKRRAKYNSKG